VLSQYLSAFSGVIEIANKLAKSLEIDLVFHLKCGYRAALEELFYTKVLILKIHLRRKAFMAQSLEELLL
jgi:hypothetical protein